MTQLADAHIEAQARLRALTARGITTAWTGLPSYDEQDVAGWLAVVLPFVLAAQRQSVAITEAFLARVLNRQPLGIQPADLTGEQLRGTPPEDVYRRPFVTVWSALGAGRDFDDAVAAGLARATSTAQTDVQLAMRATLQGVGERDEMILGYQRVPDSGACKFCRLVAGQRYRIDELLPIHNHCGCGVDVITAANRGDFTGRADNDLTVTRDGVTAAVREHGELGLVLVDGNHDFTSEQNI